MNNTHFEPNNIPRVPSDNPDLQPGEPGREDPRNPIREIPQPHSPSDPKTPLEDIPRDVPGITEQPENPDTNPADPPYPGPRDGDDVELNNRRTL